MSKLKIPLTDRTFEKTQGCWNCVHYLSPTESLKRWQTHDRPQQDAKIREEKLKILDMPPAAATERVKVISAIVEHLDRFEGSLTEHDEILGVQGFCKNERAHIGGGYKNAAFFCDQWTGAEGASVARAGQKLDLLPEELKDIHGDGN